jgi:hypothetical protein
VNHELSGAFVVLSLHAGIVNSPSLSLSLSLSVSLDSLTKESRTPALSNVNYVNSYVSGIE